MTNTIRMIPVELIRENPDNPRKDLGDLTELAESIRVNGILQNLTVVEEGGQYTAVIGHRRLAAAKLAGLTEVPCVVAELDPKAQRLVMLCENVQRNDLTVYEQAKGFQQLQMDFGMNAAAIAESTGFSESTVRRRLALSDLDEDKFRKSQQRNVSLKDYMELEQLETTELRNRALAKIGTEDFRFELNRCLSEQQAEKRKSEWITILDKIAVRLDNEPKCWGYDRTHERILLAYLSYDIDRYEKELAEIRGRTEELFYAISQYGSIGIYIEAAKEDEDDDDEEDLFERELAEKNAKRIEELKNLWNIAQKNRIDFIKNYHGKREDVFKILPMMLEWYNEDDINSDIFGLLGIEETDDWDTFWKDPAISDTVASEPQRIMLCAICSQIETIRFNCMNYDNEYYCNRQLLQWRQTLKDIGMPESLEEAQLYGGMHKLYEEIVI